MDDLLYLLKYGSSDVDWCENNYTMVSFIAEFFNTISNVLFFVLPPIQIVLFKNYGQVITQGIHLIWIFLMLVGIGSVYFHATLSLAGQLLDELFILWVLMAGYAIMIPQTFLPIYFRIHRKVYFSCCLALGTLFTLASILNPYYNAFFLFLIGFPAVGLLLRLVKSCKEERVVQLIKRTLVILFIAIVSWIGDRAFCGFFIHLNVPYFHAIFHVFILISSHSTVVIFAYFVALYQYPTSKPVLKYWPNVQTKNTNINFLRIPFIFVEKHSERTTIFQKHA